jgi:hypothetical protein
MRYFVVEPTDAGLTIVMEVASDPEIRVEGIDHPIFTLPEAIVQEQVVPYRNQMIRVEAELLTSQEGREALDRWRAGDDSALHELVRNEAVRFYREDLVELVKLHDDAQAAELLLNGTFEEQAAYVTRDAESEV